MDGRESSNGRERRRPPKLPSEEDNCIGATQNLAFGGEHPHFLERLFSSEIESVLNPLALERFEIEPALSKDSLETQSEIVAETAILVEEDPATKGNSFLFFCYFCQIRNHEINFFRQQLRSPEV